MNKNNIKEFAEKLMRSFYDNDSLFIKTDDGTEYKITIDYDDYPENPREYWDCICHIMSIRGNWNIGDKNLSFTREDALDKLKELEKDENICIKPIYMYDHSGQTISLSPFGDPWDSGICGYIYVSKEEIFKVYHNATEDSWKDFANKAMNGEIEVYDDYIRGNVFDYYISQKHIEEHKRLDNGLMWTTEEWETIDSCSGFYGDDAEKSGMADNILGNFDEFEIIEGGK